MNPARVYLVVWWFDRIGGMERHVTDLAIALARRGIEVTVFSETPLPSSNTYVRELREAGVDISAPRTRPGVNAGLEASRPYRLLAGLDREPRVGWLGVEDDYLRHRHANAGARALLRRLETLSRRSPPGVVHVHGSRLGQHTVLQWAAARGYPSVYTEHVTMSDWGGPFDLESPWVVGDTADAIICVSDYSRASLLAHLPAPREVQVARHIVRDPRLDDPMATSPRSGGPSGANLLGVGRLSVHKGYDILLQAAARLRDEGLAFHIRIAGDGEERGALHILRDRLDLADQVTFLGQVTQSQVADLWKEADFGVAPSRTEALPLSIVEAMARGRPMVASRVGGIPEIIRHEANGLLVEPGDAEDLAAAIRRMIEEPALVATLAEGARSSFETGGWSEDAVAEQILATYAKARDTRAAKAGPSGATRIATEVRIAAGDIGDACLFVWRLSSFGSMEHLVAQQARALANAGVRVAVFVDQPVRPFNAYVRAMRRAGVEVIMPALPLGLARRLWARLTGRPLLSPHGRAFARRLKARRPDLLHVHGWRQDCAWMHPILRQAAGTPTVYTEHAGQTSAASADPGDLETLRTFGALSTVSASAAETLGRAAGRAVDLVGHAGQARPSLAARIPAADAPFHVFCLLSPRQMTDLVRDTASSVVTLVSGDTDPAKRAKQLAVSDAVVLSTIADGFGPALAVAMGSFKPVIICGDGETSIRRGVNGLVVAEAPAAALLDLAADRLLARQFAVAARRTYELEGLRDLAIVAETAALRRAAGA